MMWHQNFRETFLKKHECPPESYESRVFWRCLYRHALPLAGLIYLFDRDFFAVDFQTIRQLGLARSPDEFRQEVDAFAYVNRRHAGTLRTRLRIRVSGQRLMSLLTELFPQQ